tara:strand:+ start:395 stop:616 length:222 start_codon:yes stop_codon:yes gene_type:complete
MRKTLFLKTESGTVVVPRLKNSSWLGRWAFDIWLSRYFKTNVEKSAPRSWEKMSTIFEVKTLIEEDDIYRVVE